MWHALEFNRFNQNRIGSLLTSINIISKLKSSIDPTLLYMPWETHFSNTGFCIVTTNLKNSNKRLSITKFGPWHVFQVSRSFLSFLFCLENYSLAVVLGGPNGPLRRWGKARHPHQRLRKSWDNYLCMSVQKHLVHADKVLLQRGPSEKSSPALN